MLFKVNQTFHVSVSHRRWCYRIRLTGSANLPKPSLRANFANRSRADRPRSAQGGPALEIFGSASPNTFMPPTTSDDDSHRAPSSRDRAGRGRLMGTYNCSFSSSSFSECPVARLSSIRTSQRARSPNTALLSGV